MINAGLRLFTRCENSDEDWSFRINGEVRGPRVAVINCT